MSVTPSRAGMLIKKSLPLERAIGVLNSLVADRVLDTYAIGGAVAATFYVEPVLTYDLDVFVALPSQGLLVTVAPLYEYLKARGYVPHDECVEIEGVPVQFLPAGSPLVEAAIAGAVDMSYGGTEARVMRPEHLLAICVQTGRPKDRERARQLAAYGRLDEERLGQVLSTSGLSDRWRQWRE